MSSNLWTFGLLQEAEEKIRKSEKLKQELESKMKDTQSPKFKQLLFDRICLEIEKGTPEINSHRGWAKDLRNCIRFSCCLNFGFVSGKGVFIEKEFDVYKEQRKEAKAEAKAVANARANTQQEENETESETVGEAQENETESAAVAEESEEQKEE